MDRGLSTAKGQNFPILKKIGSLCPNTHCSSTNTLNSKHMDTSKMIKAYCLKTKEKNVPMQDAVITKTAKGGYMAGGHDGKGNKMAAIMSEAKALQAIADGVATKGF
jgi:hypothetical protein